MSPKMPLSKAETIWLANKTGKHKAVPEIVDYDLSKCRALVADYGHFLSHAQRMSRDFKETIFVPLGWKGAFPKPEKSMIGQGIPGITQMPNFWEALKKIDPEHDLVAFFDVGDGDLAEHLRAIGYKRVFSMGKSEEIEMNRYKHKETLEKLGLPVIPFNGGDWKKGHVVGISGLEQKLSKITDKKWVKLSTFRGLQETFEYESMIQVNPILTRMRHLAGAYAEQVQFLIEDDVPAIEGGSDNFTSGIDYFPMCIQGFEDKGNGYAGKPVETKSLSKPLLNIIEKMQPYFNKNGGRGMFSTEVRISSKDGTAYYTDATQRSGNPPGDLQMLLWANISKMIYAAAGGEVVEPEETGKYGIQLNLHSEWAENESLVIEYPKKYEDNVKLRNIAKLDGYLHYIPMSSMQSVGSVVTVSNTIEDAWNQALEIAEQVKGIGINYNKNLLSDLKEKMIEGEQRGLGKF